MVNCHWEAGQTLRRGDAKDFIGPHQPEQFDLVRHQNRRTVYTPRARAVDTGPSGTSTQAISGPFIACNADEESDSNGQIRNPHDRMCFIFAYGIRRPLGNSGSCVWPGFRSYHVKDAAFVYDEDKPTAHLSLLRAALVLATLSDRNTQFSLARKAGGYREGARV